MDDEAARILDHKFVIFDTNILLKALDHFEAFKELLDFFKEKNCRGVRNPLIEFEFLNGSFTPVHLEERLKFLEIVVPTSLPLNDQIIKEAVNIARIYAHQKIANKQIYLVDSCIAAYLKQFHNNLFLVTLNHRDFPVVLFDRIQCLIIEDDSEVFAPAIYRFSLNKWDSLWTKLEKVK